MEVQVLLYPVCAYKSTWCHGPGDSSVTAVRTSDQTHKVCHPRCVHKLTRVECMYLYNTSFNGRGIYSIYYIRYMFWHLTMALFRLYMKYLLSSYMRLIIQCGLSTTNTELEDTPHLFIVTDIFT